MSCPFHPLVCYQIINYTNDCFFQFYTDITYEIIIFQNIFIKIVQITFITFEEKIMEFRKNFSLLQYNTFGIDVKASLFAEAESFFEIRDFLNNYRRHYADQPLLVIGGGSNILFTGNYEGIVLKINNKGIEIVQENNESLTVKVASGEDWSAFVHHCVINEWHGLENLSMIPGNTGSSPVQNIGAYGVEVKDYIKEVESININTGEIKVFDNESCKFSYRDSIFKTSLKNQYIILNVSFKLSKKPVYKIEYPALKEELDKSGKCLSIDLIASTVISIRRKKLPDYKEYGNAGSFFKNPCVSYDTLESIKKEFYDINAYQLADGTYKVPAAYLIEKCGWKGKKYGNAGVYEKQALILINYGKATGSEIAELALKIKESVFQKFNIMLETEVNIL